MSSSAAQAHAPVIEAQALTRHFGRRRALEGLDFAMARGEIVGLVGPNGAGKTTFLKLLAGLLRPSSGRVRVMGREPFGQRAEVVEHVRFAFAPPPLYPALSALEHLQLLTRLAPRGAPRPTRAEIDGALATVGLADRARDRVRTYSFGMRQRLALAQALLPRPKLLVLDEPTDGLDPLAVLELRGVLARLREEHGVAILLSSHLMIEVEELVDRLLVLEEGRALFLGEPAELRAGSERLVLEAEPLERAREALEAEGFGPEVDGHGRLLLPVGALSLDEAATLFDRHGARLTGLHVERPSLESALLARYREARS